MSMQLDRLPLWYLLSEVNSVKLPMNACDGRAQLDSSEQKGKSSFQTRFIAGSRFLLFRRTAASLGREQTKTVKEAPGVGQCDIVSRLL